MCVQSLCKISIWLNENCCRLHKIDILSVFRWNVQRRMAPNPALAADDTGKNQN